ncbi:MAG: Threonylcarbamoyl-AMP synthase / SUA5 domain with internal deletion [uncultured Gemmatimonadetes bacterium]|uniref:Threonylcarbamoyl-AMP synthase n=1 Tax=uncultured Gemmatimonadota bacterium TaxID=203437 RepID=A0A6J4K9J3_9BACT|nr:MAG: Threonylcarbamoyl-AMP synthase / SUA5 domain with internal deletion [uncultured Gemmatimonadota bacterium]
MKILSIDPAAPEAGDLGAAVDALRAGGLVAFPTETVYGLGANALDPAAVARIFAAKGRPEYNPIIVHAANTEAARELTSEWPLAAARLADAFWPGPLTLILPKAPHVLDALTAGLPNVALRVPAHPVAQALLAAAGLPLAAPSANRSTEVSPTTAEHVVRSLGEAVDVVVDGGPCPVGIESTVVSLASATPTILRPGSITQDDISAVIGVVLMAEGEKERPGAALPSPGQMDRHYAPRAELRLIDPERSGLVALLEAVPGLDAYLPVRIDGRTYDEKTAVLAYSSAEYPGARVVRMPQEAAGYATNLYAMLHELDAQGYQRILVERVPDEPEWAGVRDRLQRASQGSA